MNYVIGSIELTANIDFIFRGLVSAKKYGKPRSKARKGMSIDG
jgi:hypothetical protein